MVFNFLKTRTAPTFHFDCQVDNGAVVKLKGGFHARIPYINSKDNENFYSLIKQMEKGKILKLTYVMGKDTATYTIPLTNFKQSFQKIK